MSTTTSQSQLPRMVRDFLAAEEEKSRVWLRAEMDRLVDPLVDSVFARLTNKLMINMGWGQLGDGSDCSWVKQEIKEEDDEMTLQNVMDSAPEGNQQIGDCVKQEIKEEEEDGEMLDIKEEEEKEDEDEPTRSNNFELMPMSHQTHNSDMSLANASTISNEAQSNLTIRVEDNEDHVNRNIQHQFEETNNNGGMMQIEEEEVEEGEVEDGDARVTDIEEMAANEGGNEDEDDQVDGNSSRLVKRPRIDSTQPNLALPNLQRHLQVDTGERSFQCDQCDKRFTQRRNLTRHQLIHQNIKNYRCTQCDKQFTRTDLLDSHLRTHSRERPFACRHCEMSFTKLDTRTRHERAIHLHVKPYRCKQCGQTATQRSVIIRHIRVFGLPETIKGQQELNIIDERDPRELVEKV